MPYFVVAMVKGLVHVFPAIGYFPLCYAELCRLVWYWVVMVVSGLVSSGDWLRRIVLDSVALHRTVLS